MPIKEIPSGDCPKCGTPRFKKERVVICPSCDVQGEASGLVNYAEDPGHEAMEKILKAQKPEELPPMQEKRPIQIPPRLPDVMIPDEVIVGPLGQALRIVEAAPMPGDMKDIKKLLKVKQLLKELVNG